MKRVLSANALDCFTDICDSNAPKVIEKVEAAAKEILKNDTWLKEHVQTIAACTVVYDQLNVQELVESTVRSSETKKIIDMLAKTTCIGHAATSRVAFSDTISEETEEREREEREQQFNEEQERHKQERQKNHRFASAYDHINNDTEVPN